jgi:hypothetical protein
MRNLMWVGLVLIVLGVAGLMVQNVTITERQEVLDVGPLEVNTEEQHTVPIPTILGIVALSAGVALIIASRRRGQ